MEMVGKYNIKRSWGLVWNLVATLDGVSKVVALNPNMKVTEEILDKVFES